MSDDDERYVVAVVGHGEKFFTSEKSAEVAHSIANKWKRRGYRAVVIGVPA